jgi:hypothetical protein
MEKGGPLAMRNGYAPSYPIFAFLAIWMDEAGLGDFLAHFDDILRAAFVKI